MHLEIPLSGKKWLQDAWVGRLQNLTMYDRIEEDMLWDFGLDIVPKYIGEDMVLLLGLIEEKARRLMEVEEEGRDALFYLLERWNPTVRVRNRLTWV